VEVWDFCNRCPASLLHILKEFELGLLGGCRASKGASQIQVGHPKEKFEDSNILKVQKQQ
jgi:hypothetical protein